MKERTDTELKPHTLLFFKTSKRGRIEHIIQEDEKMK
jgi:hypothetical protein